MIERRRAEIFAKLEEPDERSAFVLQALDEDGTHWREQKEGKRATAREQQCLGQSILPMHERLARRNSDCWKRCGRSCHEYPAPAVNRGYAARTAAGSR